MTVKAEYARQLAGHFREMESIKEIIDELVASAKDVGIDPKSLRKVAREMVMNSDKRAKLYDDEDQLSLFRTEVGLTSPAFAEAAE